MATSPAQPRIPLLASHLYQLCPLMIYQTILIGGRKATSPMSRTRYMMMYCIDNSITVEPLMATPDEGPPYL